MEYSLLDTQLKVGDSAGALDNYPIRKNKGSGQNLSLLCTQLIFGGRAGALDKYAIQTSKSSR